VFARLNDFRSGESDSGGHSGLVRLAAPGDALVAGYLSF
jgi:hypothetical protein